MGRLVGRNGTGERSSKKKPLVPKFQACSLTLFRPATYNEGAIPQTVIHRESRMTSARS